MTGRPGPHSTAWHGNERPGPHSTAWHDCGLEDQEPRGGPGIMVSNVCMTGRPGPHATAWHYVSLD